MSRKVKSFKQIMFYRNNVRFQNLQQVFEVQSFGLGTGTQSFCWSFIALSIIRCSKSAQKFAVRVCQVATVVMETTKLALSQFKTFLSASLYVSKRGAYW